MGHRLARNIVVTFMGLVLAYSLASVLVPARLLIEIGDALAIPMSLAACLIYFKEVWTRPRFEPMTPTDIVMIGIAGGWLVNALDRGLRLWARLHDASVLDEPVIGLLLVMLMYFAALHVYVRGQAANYGRAAMQGSTVVKVSLMFGILLSIIVVLLELQE